MSSVLELGSMHVFSEHKVLLIPSAKKGMVTAASGCGNDAPLH